jgi:formate dehydrogenase maturation protein FdhE
MSGCPVCGSIPLVDATKEGDLRVAKVACLASSQHAYVVVKCAAPLSAFDMALAAWDGIRRKAKAK